jgi:hypothetical protein
MQEVAAEIERQLAKQESALDALISEDLTRLNGLASDLAVPYVLTPEAVRR